MRKRAPLLASSVVIETLLAWLMTTVTACAAPPTKAPAQPVPAAVQSAPELTSEERVARAEQLIEHSQYPKAEEQLRQLPAQPEPLGSRAELAWVQLLLSTGRYAEAELRLTNLQPSEPSPRVRRALLLAESQRRRGQLDRARTTLEQVSSLAEGEAARLALGEVLLTSGRRDQAEPLLLSLIDAYNAGAISAQEGPRLGRVGRAAHLLRSPRDANDAFNESEAAGNPDVATLLWRAELFLEKYSPAQALQLLDEVLQKAPHHADALVLKAAAVLQESLDFRGAQELLREALRINPHLCSGYFLLAGLALRDLDFEAAEKHLQAGLAIDPNHLDLLSMQGTARFLADDLQGLALAKQRVLTLNPQYTRFFNVITEYAEWEHRYDDIIALAREAIAIDDDDAQSHAQLGLNLIRSGDDAGGLGSLRRAFAKDPYNVRVYNTLNLYEDILPQHYVQVRRGKFLIRYPKAEFALLDRYVPKLLERAYAELVEAYAFEPSVPLGIELYSDREHFAVRTSGLPHTAIQGVCFGRTLASLTPANEAFNLGMVLWHELSHVFHIQLSKSHVPRWFTEGLAEYETIVARPEWRREHDVALFESLKTKQLPSIGSMNRAFTHVDDLEDVATAYYAASQLAAFLVERYGRLPLNQMLSAWGQGARTPDVIRSALGVSAEQLDRDFRSAMLQQLARYEGQFVPPQRFGDPEQLIERAKRQPGDPELQARVALLQLTRGQLAPARLSLERAKQADAAHPLTLWAGARLQARGDNPQTALPLLEQMLRRGQDGYFLQRELAALHARSGDLDAARAALERAHVLDASQSAPLVRLLELATDRGDSAEQQRWLEKLVLLEQHHGDFYRRLTRLLLNAGNTARALEVAEAALYADMEHSETHAIYAEALLESQNLEQARFELDSALLAAATPQQRAAAHRLYARLLTLLGQPGQAREHALEAERASSESSTAPDSSAPHP